jgi:hypothetical protein
MYGDQRAAPAGEREPDGDGVASEDRGLDRVAGDSTEAIAVEASRDEDEPRRQHPQVVQHDGCGRAQRWVERCVRPGRGSEGGPGHCRDRSECLGRSERDPTQTHGPEIIRHQTSPGVGPHRAQREALWRGLLAEARHSFCGVFGSGLGSGAFGRIAELFTVPWF